MNRATGPGKYLQNYEMCSKENKHRDLGSKRVIHEFDSPGKLNLSPGKVLRNWFLKNGRIFFRQLKLLMQFVYTFSST